MPLFSGLQQGLETSKILNSALRLVPPQSGSEVRTHEEWRFGQK